MVKKVNDTRRQWEIIGVLLMTLSVLLAISFATYSANDELTVNRYFIIENAMGIIGVFASSIFIKLGLGYFSWGLLVLTALWGWWLFSDRNRMLLLRFTSYFIILLYLLATMFSIPALKARLHLPGGYVTGGLVGGATSDLLQDWLGVLPTLILLSVLVVILVFAFFRISMFGPFVAIQERLKSLLYGISYKWRIYREKRSARKEAKAKEKEQQKANLTEEAAVILPADDVHVQDAESVSDSPLSFGDDENILTDDIPEVDGVPEQGSSSDHETPLYLSRMKEEAEEDAGAESGVPEEEDAVDDYEVEEKLSDEDINYDETREQADRPEYKLPSVDLLNEPAGSQEVDPEELNENARILTQTLADFGVSGKVTKVIPGPVVTLYEVEPATGVRVNRISVLSDDIARVMSAKRIRIIAPIPGKNVVGVEIPNKSPEIVYFKSIVNSETFSKGDSVLSIALGKTVNGQPFTFHLDKMPHLLIAGTTGSGKSVCINTLIMSILYRAKPQEVKFIMVDPKKLELSVYKALVNYHLITSEDIDEYVITTPQNAVMALRSAEVEMERRYTVMSEAKVRNIAEYNQKAELQPELTHLPYIVVIIDELADLMITASREIEEPIARLAQMARAVGIHLVVATQRPSVDVITGVIRSNFPARIAFQVPTKIDSRTILDTAGAEKLLGKGDMLFLAPGTSEPVRVHNSFVVLDEIEAVLEHITSQSSIEEEFMLPSAAEPEGDDADMEFGEDGERDKLFDQALRLVVQHQQGSISLVQRRLRVGYSRAARLIDELEHAGIVGPFTGSKAREVLVDPSYLERIDSFEDGSFDED